jgi:Holliday junction resolvase
MLVDGKAMVPKRAVAPNGTLGDTWVEVKPDDPEYPKILEAIARLSGESPELEAVRARQRASVLKLGSHVAMEIIKSSRHSKIVGDFGERLVLNWLSRSGFEASILDHTGADIVAYNKVLNRRLAISVKSRTRTKGTESDSLFLFRKAKDREKLQADCEAFNAEAWLAIYIECELAADLFFTSLENYDQKYRVNKAAGTQAWSMNAIALGKYKDDPEIKHIHVEFEPTNWW